MGVGFQGNMKYPFPFLNLYNYPPHLHDVDILKFRISEIDRIKCFERKTPVTL